MLRQIRALQARRISTASSPYENYTKLRAFPFHISPEKAQRLLSPWGAFLTCNREKIWPSIGGALQVIPFLNHDFLRPARFSAVYFPAWFVTGEVEASVTYKGTQLKLDALFDNTYIPGSHVPVLSTAPLNSNALMYKKAVPFSTSLLHQHGEPVQCIPFSTSPFSVLDMAASHLPSRPITINKDLSISSVKPNLISAYPVLLPLYLAQYEMKDGKDGANMYTFILKAAYDLRLDSIMCENFSKVDEDTREFIESFTKLINHESSGEVNTFFPECPRVSMPAISLPYRRIITNPIKEWLEESLCSSRNIEILAESSLGVIGKGDDDLRMREMTSEEGASLKNYTKETKLVINSKMLLKLIERGKERSRFLLFLSKQNFTEWVEEHEAKRAQLVPKWWSEWLALNRPGELESGDEEEKKKKNAAAGGTPNRPPVKNSDKFD